MKNGISINEEEKNQLQRDARLARWRLQREAQELLPEERVAFCMRHILMSKVDVCYSSTRQSARYRGLMKCGSVWVCPLCASKISERRRNELDQAINSHITKGGVVYLATYTVSHKQYDTLSELLKAFLSARKRAKQGRAAQELQKHFDVLGTVSVREVTWSKENGWHPHCHELIFFRHEIDVDAYSERVRQQWAKSAELEGLSMNEHGFQFDRTDGAVADYVAKFGREPLKAPWGAATELTKAHMKHGRNEEHLTPFGMLEQISQGDDELRSIFLEYAQWFKGKRQLVWSPGLRALLLEQSEEVSDTEVVQEVEEDEILLGQLSRSQWSIVLKSNVRGRLLEVARTGDWQCVVEFLCSIGADNEASPILLGKTTNSVSHQQVEGHDGSEAARETSQCIAESKEPIPSTQEYVKNVEHGESFMSNKNIRERGARCVPVRMKNGIDQSRLPRTTEACLSLQKQHALPFES